MLKRSTTALFLSLLTVSAVTSAEEPRRPHQVRIVDLQSGEAQDLVQAEGRQDPPGVLNKHNQESIRQLAINLSLDRSWLTGEVLTGLDTMSVHLDEIFAEAPEFIEIKGKLYRVVLEKVGPAWQDFINSRSSYLVFLNHEVYDELGEDHALAFESGEERVIALQDIEKTAAIGLTLRGITPDERPKTRRDVVGLESSIRLGKVRPRFRSQQDTGFQKFLAKSQVTQASCSYVAAPSACSNGVPVCASPTAKPYFVLSALKIKTDHEGTFKGDPEVELFPLRINTNSPYGGSTDVRTQWIFSGRYVTDLAGRSTYLPNVNNNDQWYYVTNGLALFPSDLSNSWASTLVENDDDAGRLEIDRNKYNPVKPPREAYVQLVPFDLFDFLKDLVNLVITLGLLNDSDDLFVQSLEVNNNLFCSEALGQPFPHNFLLTGTEWDMQGHFACIDPACAPDPCGGDPCCGDPCCGDPYCGGGCGTRGEICP